MRIRAAAPLLILGLAALAAGCMKTPQQSERDRTLVVAALFPDPADREGIHAVFTVESFNYLSNLEVFWFPDTVDDAGVKARVDRYCARQKAQGKNAAEVARLRRAPQDGSIKMQDGTVRPARSAWYACTPG